MIEDNDSFNEKVTPLKLPLKLNIEDSNDEKDLKESELRTKERCVLEDYTRCSKSHLWKLMMSFYDRKGPESWSQGIVPHFITCNTFIGKAYAKVLHGFIRDCMKPNSKLSLDINEPLYIVELGVGSGKFSYFMLKALDDMKLVCDFPFDKIIYVMTDFTKSNYNFWLNHPNLKPYFESGRLDAGIFDAVTDDTITLQKSGVVLKKNSLKNPLCIVANYLFDTLYHDIFQIQGGILKEGLVSVGSLNASEPDPLDPEIINRLDNSYKYEPITPNYYDSEDGDEPYLRRLLKWYHNHFQNTALGASILVPIGALRALRNLCRFSNNRVLIISGDKGNNNPDQFTGLMDPHIAVHGSFSLMVNYHAIGAWITNKGGFALHNPQEEASLKVGCFVLLGDENIDTCEDKDELWLGDNLDKYDNERSKSFVHLYQSFQDNMNNFGPNDFFVLQKSLKEDVSTIPLRTVISILKLSDWDPDVFFKFRDIILSQAPNCSLKLKHDLTRGIPSIFRNYYIMDTEKDIAFEIGRYYYGIRDYNTALEYYKISLSTIGEHHVTYHNQGLCYYSLGKLDLSLSFFEKAHNMNFEYEKAKSWVKKVKNEILKNSNKDINIKSIEDETIIIDDIQTITNEITNMKSLE